MIASQQSFSIENTGFKRVLSWIIFFSLAVCFVGIAGFAEGFAKLKVGPFYILEIEFLLCLFCGVLILNGRPFFVFKNFKPEIAFFAWGFILLVVGLVRGLHSGLPINWMRSAQHCILFVYPLIWSMIGFSVYSIEKKMTRYLTFSLMAFSAIISLQQDPILNTSFGPLLLIPLLFYLCLKDYSKKNILISSFLVLISFIPIWKMSLHTFRRTYLLMFLIMLVTAPPLILRFSSEWRKISKIILSLSCLLVIGFFVTLVAFKHDINPSQITEAMRHGDDMPRPESAKTFQFRTRRFLWTRAFDQWLEQPVVGVGFLKEVPDLSTADLYYLGGRVLLYQAPLSGPHNSYLSILARMGVVGMALFLWLVFNWFEKVRGFFYRGTLALEDLLYFYIPLNGLIYGFLNVGFEAPQYCFLMWFFWGVLKSKIVQDTKNRK